MSALDSPCIDVCTLDAATQSCIGCGRTMAEIRGWIAFTPARRSAINAELPGRRARFEAQRLADAARIAGGWDAIKCSRCGAAFVCGAKDCSTPCWCASYPPIAPVGDATCLCPACLSAAIPEPVALRR
jgi:predicted Fe-S protein YdhL (DUF1289 family)